MKKTNLTRQGEIGPREWSIPRINAIVPVERGTRGGFGDVNDQDDIWYVS